MSKQTLKPDFYVESIFQIPYDSLYEKGIRGLIYDIDNTLVTHDDKHPPTQILALIEELREKGFSIGLLSNNTSRRIGIFNKDMKLPGLSMAAKPFTAALRRLMHNMEVAPSQTAIIGDQLFADIWCGKRAGITTVLVKPITETEVITARLKRGLERRFLKKYYSGTLNLI